jgi:hypothetical protein
MKSEPKSAWHKLVDYLKQVVGYDDSPNVGRRDADDEGRRIGFPEKLPAFAKIPR